MTTVVLELITGIVLIGTMIKYKLKKPDKEDPEPEIYGRYCICYAKGNPPGEVVFIPWKSCVYQTEDEYEKGEEEVVKLSLDRRKNRKLREQGITGIAIIDMSDAREQFWCTLAK